MGLFNNSGNNMSNHTFQWKKLLLLCLYGKSIFLQVMQENGSAVSRSIVVKAEGSPSNIITGSFFNAIR
jgi:hypothetical protein